MVTTAKRRTADDKAEAVRELRKLLKPGSKVYTVLRHCSSSGMTRHIDLFTIRGGELRFLSGYAGRALGIRRAKRGDGLVVGGCGMDMGFHLVYELSRVLFPKGFKVPATTCYGCQGTGLRDGERCFDCQGACVVFRGRNGDQSGWDNDGGYALKHSWL